MSRSRNVRRGLSALLLPLSAVPVAYAAPKVVEDYDSYQRTHLERDAIAPPAQALSAAERRFYVPASPTNGRIPVLAYHGIADSDDGYSVTREQFAEHMAMLDEAGFQTVSAEQYARALAGEDVDLPERPILVSFDDGRLNSYRGADEILEQHGFRATVFVIADRAGDERSPSFLSWDELRSMAGSGRWDVQLHAGTGHRQVTTGPQGRTGSFMANRVYRHGGLEPRAEAYDRITRDVEFGERRLREEVAGVQSWTYAVPFGDLGQDGRGNDARLTKQVSGWLKQRYGAVFVQSEQPRLAGAGDAHKVVHRRPIHSDTTAAGLYRWLQSAHRDEGS